MIEILIAISIIVTFSSLTGAVFARKYEESKESYAKLDLVKIQEGLIMYFTKNSRYPLDLDQLLENGDLSKIPTDPWGSPYLYVPFIDWLKLSRLLNVKNPKSDQFTLVVESIKKLNIVLNSLPDSVESINILAMASEQPFAICLAPKLVRFPSSVNVNISRDKLKQIGQLIKQCHEKSTTIPELHEALSQMITQIKA